MSKTEKNSFFKGASMLEFKNLRKVYPDGTVALKRVRRVNFSLLSDYPVLGNPRFSDALTG